MVPDESSIEFQNRLRLRGLHLSSLAPDVGFAEAFTFYRDVRPMGCVPVEHQGDTLLYQWGIHDWGKGIYFNLNLTRQFVLEDLEDDDAIFQLGLTFFYPPSSTFKALNQGNRWCESPADLVEFERFVLSSNAYRTALENTPTKVELDYGNAG